MTGKVNYLSSEGLKKLEQELNDLKTKRIPEVAKKIEEAKALGDLKENAEYHAAKDERAQIQGRIYEIEDILKNVSIIDEDSINRDIVSVGSTIEVESNKGKREYKIVGSTEADPLEGLISNESPLGKAFLGHKVGDKVVVEVPAGNIEYIILKIK